MIGHSDRDLAIRSPGIQALPWAALVQGSLVEYPDQFVSRIPDSSSMPKVTNGSIDPVASR